MKLNIGLIILACAVIASCSFKEDQPPKVIEVPEKKTDAELSNELFDAVLKKDYKSVEALIAAGTDLEQYDSQGNTVLIRSVQMRDAVLVEMLLKAKAMPFGSIKNSPKETAYSKIHKDDTEIQKIFDQKISLLTGAIAKSLSASNFGEALAVIKENNIPLDFPMAHQTLAEYPFVFITEPIDRAENLLKYLIEGRSYEKLDILKNQERLLIAANNMQNKDFFSYIIDIIVQEKIAANKSMVMVGTELLSGIKAEELKIEDSVNKPNWLAKQLEVIAQKESVIVNFEYMNRLAQGSIKNSIGSDSLSAIRVHSSFLSLNFPASHKNSFTEDVIKLVFSASGLSDRLALVKNILVSWKNANLEKTGYSLDIHTQSAFKSMLLQNASENIYIEITNLLMDYTTDRDATNTLSEIIQSNISLNQKTTLVQYSLGYCGKIPQGAFAAAIKSNNIAVLSLLASSGVPFDPAQQTEAIEAAVKSSKTGPIAQANLISLKQSGLSFDNSFGANALRAAILMIVENNDTSYVEVVDYLISIPDHPVNNFADDEKVEIINSLLDYAMKNSILWNTLHKMLLKSDAISKTGQLFNKMNPLSKSLKLELKSSVPWSLVLHIFETRKSNKDDGSLFPILKQLLRVFGNEYVSMNTVEKGATANPQMFSTQQMLPLSLILWAGKDNVVSSLKDSYSTESTFAQTLAPVGYETFVNNDLYAYLSTDKEFWLKIIKEIISNQKIELQTANPSSMYDLLKIVIGSGVLDSIPETVGVISKFNTPVLSSDTECRFENVSDDEIKNWTAIGSFVAIESLFKKSCSGQTLSAQESSFFKNFASKHVEEDVTLVSIPQSFDACEPLNFVATQSSTTGVEYSRRGYSLMGALLLKSSDETSDSIADILTIPTDIYFGAKCRTSKYNADTHKQAKLQLLRDWNNCVLNNQDSSMINYMQNLDSKYNFSKITSDVKVCK